MNKYLKYKDSGIEWIGKIPEHWDINKIKRNTYVKGRVGWHGLTSDEHIDEGPYLITGTDFNSGRINWDSCHHISEERYNQDPYIQIKENDILITKDGTIGKIALVNKLPSKATLNSGIFVTRPLNNEYITPYMYWILNSQVFNKYIDHTKVGSTINHLYQNVFEEFSFLIPTLKEQKAIADFLDRKTEQVDTLIEKKQKQIELLKEYRTAVINQAVTKGLTPNVKMKDSGIDWFGKIPEHWKVKKLKHISSVISKGTTPSTIGKGISDSGKIRFIKAENIVDDQIYFPPIFYISSETNKALSRSILYDKDILFVIAGATLGKVAIVNNKHLPANTNQAISFVRLNNHGHCKFTWYWLKSNFIKKQLWLDAVQSAQPNLSMGNLGNFVIPYPPIEDQQKIANYLDQKTTEIDRLIKVQDNIIAKLKEYRTALISEAVTGKIDVRGNVVDVQPVKQANVHFQRSVLGAEILDRFHSDKNFGRVKLQKIIYLCENYLGMNLDGNYKRDAAGPFDNTMLRSLHSQIERQKWFKPIKRKDETGGYIYKKMVNAGGHKKYFNNYWASPEFEKLMDIVKPMSTQQCEIVATLFAVWNDFILEGKDYTDKDIINEVLTSWHDSKTKIDKAKWPNALKWMRDKNIIPKGIGKKTN